MDDFDLDDSDRWYSAEEREVGETTDDSDSVTVTVLCAIPWRKWDIFHPTSMKSTFQVRSLKCMHVLLEHNY